MRLYKTYHYSHNQYHIPPLRHPHHHLDLSPHEMWQLFNITKHDKHTCTSRLGYFFVIGSDFLLTGDSSSFLFFSFFQPTVLYDVISISTAEK